MILTGPQRDARTAHLHGLVARISTQHKWLDDAQEVAREIAARPRVAQLLAKPSLRAALEMSLTAGIGFERAAYQIALASADAREGLSAFLDRREPSWSGR
jgi:enoyl-CoA hydratase